MVIALGSLVVMVMVVSLSIFGFGVVSNFFLIAWDLCVSGFEVIWSCSP